MEAVLKIKSMTEATDLPKLNHDSYKRYSLHQIMSKMQYALIDPKTYNILHQPFYCKDYFNEIIATEIDGQSRNMYGFTSIKLPFNLLEEETFTLALIRRSGLENDSKFADNIVRMLQKIEEARGYLLTTVEKTADKGSILVKSDIKWMSTPAYMSFYALLLRLAYNYDEDYGFLEYINNIYKKLDSRFKIKAGDNYAYNGIEPLMSYIAQGGELPQKWEDYLDMKKIHTLHNYSGVKNYYTQNKEMLDKLIKEYNDNNSKESSNEI